MKHACVSLLALIVLAACAAAAAPATRPGGPDKAQADLRYKLRDVALRRIADDVDDARLMLKSMELPAEQRAAVDKEIEALATSVEATRDELRKTGSVATSAIDAAQALKEQTEERVMALLGPAKADELVARMNSALREMHVRFRSIRRNLEILGISEAQRSAVEEVLEAATKRSEKLPLSFANPVERQNIVDEVNMILAEVGRSLAPLLTKAQRDELFRLIPGLDARRRQPPPP